MDEQPAARDRPVGAVVRRKPVNPPSVPLLRDKAPITPYRLREGSKLPSRYRDTEPEPAGVRRSPAKPKSPKKALPGSLPARRALSGIDRAGSHISNSSQPLLPSSSGSNRSSYIDPCVDPEFPILEAQPSTSYTTSQPLSQTNTYSTISAGGASQGSQSQSNDFKSGERSHHHHGVVRFDDDYFFRKDRDERKMTKQERDREILGAKVGLQRLQSLLFVHKARRWSICEFFYSAVDEQLFLGENEFATIIQESFPNLKTRMMNRIEWRTIRRLLGKPRRCSPSFFLEERQALEQKRAKIRSIYEGTFFNGNNDHSDLPMKIPRPLVVGMRVYARIHSPKDGIYGGNIDAVLKSGYRVIFEKEDMIDPMVVPDHQIMLDGRLELVPINYFMEQSNSKLPFTVRSHQISNQNESERRPDVVTMAHSKLAKQKRAAAGAQLQLPGIPVLGSASVSASENVRARERERELREREAADNKVGNFPVRMLVILVKLSKLIDVKRKLLRQLSDLNAEAEHANLLTDVYHPVFQEKYAKVVVDIESLNRQMHIYLQGIQEYNDQLMPQLNEVNSLTRPETLRRACTTHSSQIVKHCNQGLNVTNPKALGLVTSLTSLLLQIRTLGKQKLTPLDLNTLGESLNEIRSVISAKNVAWFQDHVEVHMKQIHNTMLEKGAFTG